MSYRQFTWWVHGYLGRHHRISIPACAVAAIRQQFPEADPSLYKGFEPVDEEDSQLLYPGTKAYLAIILFHIFLSCDIAVHLRTKLTE